MTAPALPPLPLEVKQALDDLIDRVLEVGRDPMRVVEGAEAYAALVRAIARALGGADAAHRAEVDAAVAKEREACTARCDKTADDLGRLWELAEDEMARRDLHVRRYQAQRDAAAIRARGVKS